MRIRLMMVLALFAAALVPTVAVTSVGSAAVTKCDGLAWQGTSGGVRQIWTANSDGSSRGVITAQLGEAPQDNGDVQWSLDGERIVWSGVDENGVRQIYVANKDGEGRSTISNVGNAPPTENATPQWSPDGSRIVWSARDAATGETHVFVADDDGTNRRNISVVVGDTPVPTANLNPQWSPDGVHRDRIVWSGTVAGDDVVDGRRILVADAADGTNRIVVSGSGDDNDDPSVNVNPQWAPDGNKIAWSGFDREASNRRIYTAEADGEHRLAVTRSVGSDFFPQWSFDGLELVWHREDAGAIRIGSVFADSSGEAVTTLLAFSRTQRPELSHQRTLAFFGEDASNDNQILTFDEDFTLRVISDVGVDAPTDNQLPQWSPDGSRLAWQGNDGVTNQIFIADANGENRIEVSSVADPTANRDAQWSPDGSQVAWVGTDGGEWLYVADADGNDRRRLASISSSAALPQWSPSGGRLAWHDFDNGTFALQIFVSDLDGSDPLMLSAVNAFGGYPKHNIDPQWSPDGERIVWQGGDSANRFRLYIADVDGQNRTSIFATNIGEFVAGVDVLELSPQWSPDGSQIVWSGGVPGVQHIYAMPVAGGARVLISEAGADPDPTDNRSPQWSPDGARVAWSGFPAGAFSSRIYVANADGSDRTVVSGGLSANVTPEWSPDGGRLAWSGFTGSGNEILVADPDGGNQAAVSPVGGDGPIGNGGPQWRPRGGDVSLTGTSPSLVVGEDVVLTVKASAACSHAGVTVTGLSAPRCLADTNVSVSAGSLAGSVWTIPLLEGSATATISGTVASVGACAVVATLAQSVPASNSVVIATSGGTATNGGGGGGGGTVGGVVSCPAGDAHGFVDVSPSSFANADIACMKALEITTGTSATTYDPAGQVTREQMAAFLARTWRTLGSACSASLAHGFIDVSATSFAAADIACIKDIGITTGTSATTYDPSGDVTREQMAAFLARTWRLLGNSCPTSPAHGFGDVPATSFANADITCLKALGITGGTTATTYSPGDSVTREQMAAFLGRLIRANANQ